MLAAVRVLTVSGATETAHGGLLEICLTAAYSPQTPQQGQEEASAKVPKLVGGASILARLRAERAKSAAKAKSTASARAYIVYASQTGTANEIANGMAAEAGQHGVKAQAMSCNELGFEKLAKMPAPTVVVLIAASTGDGDCPDNSASFFAHMKRRSLESNTLAHVRFTCLGLGDSNYTRFMAVSRAFRTRFQDLGAQRFYDFKEADEVDGIEPIVEAWVAGLWAPLKQTLQADASSAVQSTEAPAPAANGQAQKDAGIPALIPCRVALQWLEASQAARVLDAEKSYRPGGSEIAQHTNGANFTADQPFWASLSCAQRLSAQDSDRTVLHLELDTSGSGMSPDPGDSLGVVPQNDPDLVAALLARLGWDGRRVFSVAPAAGSGSEDGGDTKLLPHLHWPCSIQHALTYHCDIASPPRKSLLRLLAEQASMQRLSVKENGHASVQLPVFVRSGGAFKPPSTLTGPWIMIGPGTGVAPFRGFLQRRRKLLHQSSAGHSAGQAWLFCGCRRRQEDFLYGQEFQRFVAEGILSRLHVAFSRAGPSKVYVQHLIREQAAALAPLLTHPEAHIFICGDGTHMARDVHAALLDVLTGQAGAKAAGDSEVLSAAKAAEHLSAMAGQGRYVRDIWS
ncbi:hypothetical protein WJX73_010755 [Symbiochloris irregularis]|uniref:Methionine synthase reductase n=1 Tax=Symbiochloris irregularis TaxID=706552 RepID=A0AAW1PBT2_9CHLO